jgi:hypothetical protein
MCILTYKRKIYQNKFAFKSKINFHFTTSFLLLQLFQLELSILEKINRDNFIVLVIRNVINNYACSDT